MQVTFKVRLITPKRTMTVGTTSREATTIQVDEAAEDLVSFSLLLCCWITVIITIDVYGQPLPQSYHFVFFDVVCNMY